MRTAMKCRDCDSLFFLDDAGEKYYSLDEYDYDSACPECDSINLEEAFTCQFCGTPIDKDEWFCEECRDIADKWAKDLFRIMNKRFKEVNGEKLTDNDFIEALASYAEVIGDERNEKVKAYIRDYFK